MCIKKRLVLELFVKSFGFVSFMYILNKGNYSYVFLELRNEN